eukprot:2688470-Rhodomonas_salina.1
MLLGRVLCGSSVHQPRSAFCGVRWPHCPEAFAVRGLLFAALDDAAGGGGDDVMVGWWGVRGQVLGVQGIRELPGPVQLRRRGDVPGPLRRLHLALSPGHEQG